MHIYHFTYLILISMGDGVGILVSPVLLSHIANFPYFSMALGYTITYFILFSFPLSFCHRHRYIATTNPHTILPLMSAHPKIILTNGPASGRLTPTILALTLAGVPFERASLAPPGETPKGPSSLPALMSVDGVLICESYAVTQYAGVLTNTWPTDALNAARTLEVLLTIKEIAAGSWGVNFMKTVMHPSNPDLTAEKQKELREGPFKEHLLFYARRINEIITQNGHPGFSAGASHSVADFLVWQIVHQFTSGQVDHVPTYILDEFPAIKKVAANVESIEALKETIAGFKH